MMQKNELINDNSLMAEFKGWGCSHSGISKARTQKILDVYTKVHTNAHAVSIEKILKAFNDLVTNNTGSICVIKSPEGNIAAFCLVLDVKGKPNLRKISSFTMAREYAGTRVLRFLARMVLYYSTSDTVYFGWVLKSEKHAIGLYESLGCKLTDDETHWPERPWEELPENEWLCVWYPVIVHPNPKHLVIILYQKTVSGVMKDVAKLCQRFPSNEFAVEEHDMKELTPESFEKLLDRKKSLGVERVIVFLVGQSVAKNPKFDMGGYSTALEQIYEMCKAKFFMSVIVGDCCGDPLTESKSSVEALLPWHSQPFSGSGHLAFHGSYSAGFLSNFLKFFDGRWIAALEKLVAEPKVPITVEKFTWEEVSPLIGRA